MSFIKSNKTTLIIIIILLHLLWFAGGMCWKHFYNGDSYEYIYLAENIKHGWYYGANPAIPVNDYNLSARPPVYALLLLISYSLFGMHNLPIFILQNILSVFSCCLILDTFQRLYPGTKRNWLYVLFLAFYPAQQYFATMLLPDYLLQCFLMLYFRQLTFSIPQPNLKRIMWMSFWLILATLTKPIVYPFLILHLLYALWYSYKMRKALLLLAGMIPLLSLIGYGFWNKSRTGLYHISSVQTHNLIDYNLHNFLNYKYGAAYGDSTIQAINLQIQAKPDLKEKYEFADKEGKRILKDHAASYAFYHLKESIRFFIEPGKSELDLYTGYLSYYFNPDAPNFYKEFKKDGMKGGIRYLQSYPYLPLLLLVVLFNILRVIGWGLFLYNKRFSISLKLLSGIYILYFAAVTGPVANTRYFLPVLLILSSLSALGWYALMTKNKTIKDAR